MQYDGCGGVQAGCARKSHIFVFRPSGGGGGRSETVVVLAEKKKGRPGRDRHLVVVVGARARSLDPFNRRRSVGPRWPPRHPPQPRRHRYAHHRT